MAVGYSLGLAGSVLWPARSADRHGRKLMLLLGMAFSIPFSLMAAFAPSVENLILARIAGGVAAGMAYPTTLALITALWSPGPGADSLDCSGGSRSAAPSPRSDRSSRAGC